MIHFLRQYNLQRRNLLYLQTMVVEQTEQGAPEIRQRILDAAARLFHSHGYNATGMNELITAANVAKKTFYRYFDSKEAVLKAYLNAFDDKFYQMASEQIDTIADPKKRVLAIFDVKARIQQYNPFLGCPFVKINAEIGFDNHEINEIVSESKSKLRAYIRKLVTQANDKQQLNNKELTEMVFLLLDGSLLMVTIFRSAADLKMAKNLVGRFL